MEILHNVVLLLHFVGFAALFGGAFVQLKSSERSVNAAMFHGALTQLVTGLLLTMFLEFGDDPVNHAKIGVKAVILIVIMVLVFVNRKKQPLANGPFWAIFGLSLLNAAVAVFW